MMVKKLALAVLLLASAASAQNCSEPKTWKTPDDTKACPDAHVDIEDYKNGLLTAVYNGKRYTLKCSSSRVSKGKAVEEFGSEGCSELQDKVGESVTTWAFFKSPYPNITMPYVTPGAIWDYVVPGDGGGWEETWKAISITPLKRAARKRER